MIGYSHMANSWRSIGLRPRSLAGFLALDQSPATTDSTMFPFVPCPAPSQGLGNSTSVPVVLSFLPSNIQILGGFSGPTAILDKLLDPVDFMTRQPGCCLQTSASTEGILQPTSSLELSGVKPLPDCLQVPLGHLASGWKCGPTGHSPEPCGPSPWDPLPSPDDNLSEDTTYLAILEEMCNFQTSAGLHSRPGLGTQSGSDLDQHLWFWV